MSQPSHQKYSPLSRFLMIFVPDSAANNTGIFICITAFLMGLLELFSRQYANAPMYFHLSIGMMFFLVLMKFLSLYSNMVVARSSHNLIVSHIKKLKAAARSPSNDSQNAKEEAARERAEMIEAMSALKAALKHIQEDAPIRPKYEATIEMMERTLRKS